MLDRERSISSTGIPDGDQHPPWKHEGVTYGPANPTTYDKDRMNHEETLEGGGLWNREQTGEHVVQAHERDETGRPPLGHRVTERVKHQAGFSPRHEETKRTLTRLEAEAKALGLELQRVLTHEQWSAIVFAQGSASLNKAAIAATGSKEGKANLRRAIKAATKALERAVRGRR